MDKSFKFRSINKSDIKSILKIYNFHILKGLANFEEKPFSYKMFNELCLNIIKLNLPFIVCEYKKKLVGFAYLNKFRDKSGYRFSFENSIYIDESYLGIGIGNKLLYELIKKSKKNKKIKTIIAVIGGENSLASIKIHKKNGFKMIGTLKKIGFKKKLWIDSIYMQHNLNEKN